MVLSTHNKFLCCCDLFPLQVSQWRHFVTCNFSHILMIQMVLYLILLVLPLEFCVLSVFFYDTVTISLQHCGLMRTPSSWLRHAPVALQQTPLVCGPQRSRPPIFRKGTGMVGSA
jgi:hypothetical protein